MLSLVFIGMPTAHAESGVKTTDGAQILQSFNKQHRDEEHAKSITTKEKQQIMFLMGVILFLLVLITGGLGLAMGIYGKNVFVPHMLFAGLSVSMAIAHAIVGLVWFYPF
ncbi:MAG: hypothetical protein R8K48_07655 [Gallionella sp.]